MAPSLTEVEWSTPDNQKESTPGLLETARTTRVTLEKEFQELINDGKTQPKPPSYHGDELIISKQPVLWFPYAADYTLKTIRIIMDLQLGSFGKGMEQPRGRFADRSIDGHYVVRTLQPPWSDRAVQEWVNEIYLLTEIAPKHPNIIQAYGANVDDEQESFLLSGREGSFLVTDCVAELLTSALSRWCATPPPLNQRLETAMDLVSALLHLHSRKIVYYLTPGKVGFDSRYGRIKLCCFGHARKENSSTTTFLRAGQEHDVRESLVYTAPEVYSGTVSSSSDVYAFAIVLWEMVTLQHPFDGCTSAAEIYHRVVLQHERPYLDSAQWSTNLLQLVQMAWDSRLRPTMKGVHDTLELSLLFPEEEEQHGKEEYMQSRNSSYSSMEDLHRSFQEAGTKPTKHSGHSASHTSRTSESGDEEGDDVDNPQDEEEDEIGFVRSPAPRTRSAVPTPSSAPCKMPPKRVASVDSVYKTPGSAARRKKKLQLKMSPDGRLASPQTVSSSRSGNTFRVSSAAASKINTMMNDNAGESRRLNIRGQSQERRSDDSSQASGDFSQPKTPRRRPSSRRENDTSKSPRSTPQRRRSSRRLTETSENGEEDIPVKTTPRARQRSMSRQKESPHSHSGNEGEEEDVPNKSTPRARQRSMSKRRESPHSPSGNEEDNVPTKTPRVRQRSMLKRKDSPHSPGRRMSADASIGGDDSDIFKVIPRKATDHFSTDHGDSTPRSASKDAAVRKNHRRKASADTEGIMTPRAHGRQIQSNSPQSTSSGKPRRGISVSPSAMEGRPVRKLNPDGKVERSMSLGPADGGLNKLLTENAEQKSNKVLSDASLARAVGNLNV